MGEGLLSLVLFILVNFALLAHAGDPNSPRDIAQKVEDAKNAAFMRRQLEAEFLGVVQNSRGERESIPGAELNLEMKDYIDWLMEGIEKLVTRDELMTRTRTRAMPGASGVGKSDVTQKWIDMAVRFNFLKPDRVQKQHGNPDGRLELSSLRRFQHSEDKINLNPNASYLQNRDLFLDSHAFVFIDEAGMYTKPPKDPEVHFQQRLAGLKEKYDAYEKALREVKPMPAIPVEADFNGDQERYHQAMAQYRDQVSEAVLSASRVPRIDETFESAVEKAKVDHEREKRAAKAQSESWRRFWQASSGGWATESSEKEKSTDKAERISQAWLELTKFRARNKSQDALPKVEENLERAIALRRQIVRESEAQLKPKAELAETKNRIAEIRSISLPGLSGWLHEQGVTKPPASETELMGLLNRYIVETGPGGTAGSSTQGERQIGQTTAYSMLERAHDLLTGQASDLQSEIAGRAQDIKNFREEVDRLHASLEAVAIELSPTETQAERRSVAEAVRSATEDSSGTEKSILGTARIRHDLLAQYERLVQEYHDAILDAADTPSGAFAIEKFIAKLTVADLAKYPHYWDKLEKLGVSKERYLKDLQASQDLEIKLAEMLKMDPAMTRERLSDALLGEGFQEKKWYLGNFSAVVAWNDDKIEPTIRQRIENVHNEGREVTFWEYARWYEELAGKNRESALSFYKEHLPDFFNGNGGSSNPNAGARRAFGGDKPLFMKPLTPGNLLMSVPGTIDHAFKIWKARMRSKGLDLQAELSIHKNVPEIFIRDDMAAENGANASLRHVRSAIDKLLTELTIKVDELANQQPEGTPLKIRVGLVDRKLAGRNHSLGLYFLDASPDRFFPFFLEDKDIPAGTFENGSLRIGEVPHQHNPSAHLPRAEDLHTFAKVNGHANGHVNGHVNGHANGHAKDHFEGTPVGKDGKPLVFVSAHEREQYEIEQEKLRQQKELEEAAREKNEKESARRAEREVESADAERKERELSKLYRSLEDRLRTGAKEEDIRNFYEAAPEYQRDALRHRLIQLVKTRRAGANLTHLFFWLRADTANNKSADDFIVQHWDTIKAKASRGLAYLFSNLVDSTDYREEFQRMLRPSVIGRLAEPVRCGLTYSRLLGRDVPKTFRREIPRFGVFGGER